LLLLEAITREEVVLAMKVIPIGQLKMETASKDTHIALIEATLAAEVALAPATEA
jgi:hypothetical protein